MRATAVVCSGRERPQLSNGKCHAKPRLRRSKAVASEAEPELAPDVIERREVGVLNDDQISPQCTRRPSARI